MKVWYLPRKSQLRMDISMKVWYLPRKSQLRMDRETDEELILIRVIKKTLNWTDAKKIIEYDHSAITFKHALQTTTNTGSKVAHAWLNFNFSSLLVSEITQAHTLTQPLTWGIKSELKAQICAWQHTGVKAHDLPQVLT
jgi:hypothetical protein